MSFHSSMKCRTQLYLVCTRVTTVLIKLYSDFWVINFLIVNKFSFDLPISERMTFLIVSILYFVILILSLCLISRPLNFHVEPEMSPKLMFLGGSHVSFMVLPV